MNLNPGTLLQGGKYRIEKVLGQGGFGITYLAENTMLEGKVAIKEFFFKEYCDRDEATSHVTIGTSGNREIVERFKQKFIKEARTIFKLNHPNIVRILDIFEENGTAYYVMDYIEGESLSNMVKRRGSIPESEAVGYIKEVGNALSYIHGRNMNHLDIKPGNIMRRKEDGQILVIDFGVAKQYDYTTSEGTTTTPVGISKGYSPNEQYMLGGVQSFSPQSDVYALAATLYKLLTGITPPEAMLVQDEGLPIEELKSKNVSQHVIDALDAAMQSKRKRTHSVEGFISNLSGSAPVVHDDIEVTLVTSDMQRAAEERKRKEAEDKAAKETTCKTSSNPSSKKIWLWAIAGIIVVAGIIIGVSSYWGSSSNADFTEFEEVVNRETSYRDGVLNVYGITYNMIKVEGGTFIMGATSEMKDPDGNEMPTHQVTLSSYSIGETEVTQALWETVMGTNPSSFIGANKPVEHVSWDDCQTFISKLNSLTGQRFRLPTEAEWEFAARGGNKSRHTQYSGSSDINAVAWHYGNSGGTTHDVKTKLPNELGIYDMSGNVYEWCSDWYGNYSSSSQTNPKGPNSGSCRVFRGGSWINDARFCRSSYRIIIAPDYRDYCLGFRLVISQDKEEKESELDVKEEYVIDSVEAL